MSKYIDLSKTVAELVKEYPEIKEVLLEAGFKDIANPMALAVMGKVMTIPKGAAIKKISMESILAILKNHGFETQNEEPESNDNKIENEMENTIEVEDNRKQEEIEKTDRQQLLESLIERLNNGEDLERVRADFVKHFEHVSVHEIVDAEQKLIQKGMPMEKVQKLCDIHSALFHGMTEAEVWEKENQEEDKIKNSSKDNAFDRFEPGHPMSIMKAENASLIQIMDKIEIDLNQDNIKDQILKLKDIKIHYVKKAELFYPFLSQYGITGPSQVMWGVDDEIKEEIGSLAQQVDEQPYENIVERLKNVLVRAREMIYKEENILFPMAEEHFTNEQWMKIYQDIPEMGYAFINAVPKWEEAETWLGEQKKTTSDFRQGKVNLPTGEVTVKQLEAIFDLLPIDITFIDENEILRFFTNKQNIFSRPLSALGREVYACHPARVVPVVKQMIADFKEKKIDHMEIWMKKPDNPVRVQYLAVYGENDEYIGTLELVQNFGDIKKELNQ